MKVPWEMYSPQLINIPHFAKFAQVPRTDLVSRFHTSQSRSFRLTFRPRFANSRNSLRFPVGKKQIGAFRPAPRTESRCASCWHSHWTDCPYFEKQTRGPSNRWKITKSTRYMLQKSRGMFFQGKKRLRQLRHRRKGLGYPEIDGKWQNSQDQIVLGTSWYVRIVPYPVSHTFLYSNLYSAEFAAGFR